MIGGRTAVHAVDHNIMVIHFLCYTSYVLQCSVNFISDTNATYIDIDDGSPVAIQPKQEVIKFVDKLLFRNLTVTIILGMLVMHVFCYVV